MGFFEEEKLTALQAKENAQWIAFAPFVFQATRVLRKRGILKTVEAHPDGIALEDIAKIVKLPVYGVRVLVEAGLGIGLLLRKDSLYRISKTSYFILHDELTAANLDFTHDVCYKGLFNLEESIANTKPEGLKVLGDWPTLYQGLASTLPENIKESWFAFDHFYSDQAFPEVLPLVFRHPPATLLDIGGNTGKWSMSCFEYDRQVHITILDLPGYVEQAKARFTERGFGDRISFHPMNILDETLAFPKGFDAVWMSQFLDCFSEGEIISILKRVRGALNAGGSIYILETFWDRQRFEASAFSLQQTSLYFTTIANGNSQMYDSEVFIRCVAAAGLQVVEQTDHIGIGHTLLVCKPA